MLPFLDPEDELIDQLISEERQMSSANVFVDFGDPLPSRYGVDQIQLMVQSPFRIFAHWEITDTSIQETLKAFPAADRPAFQLLLKWTEAQGENERFLDAGTLSSWWFPTRPESHHQLTLGLYSEDYGWVSLLVSPEVLTPRITLAPPAPEVAEPPTTRLLLEELVRWTGIGPEPGVAVPTAELETPSQGILEPATMEAGLAIEESLILEPGRISEFSVQEASSSAIRPTSAFL